MLKTSVKLLTQIVKFFFPRIISLDNIGKIAQKIIENPYYGSDTVDDVLRILNITPSEQIPFDYCFNTWTKSNNLTVTDKAYFTGTTGQFLQFNTKFGIFNDAKWTLDFTMKINTLNRQHPIIILFNSTTAGTPAYTINIKNTNIFSVIDNSSGQVTTIDFPLFTANFSENHYKITYNDGHYNLYVNGELIQSMYNSNKITTRNYNYQRIGTNRGNTSSMDATIYNIRYSTGINLDFNKNYYVVDDNTKMLILPIYPE